MAMLWMLIIGLIAGVVAKLLMPGRDPGGIIVTTLLGVAGAFVGGLIGRVLGLYESGTSAGFIMSVIGAMLLLLVYPLVKGGRGTSATV
jgi:uncharacterized membrane protein YeaQ/YmgE (transglycosylase-associated protein family)